jgi:hypothetical protein
LLQGILLVAGLVALPHTARSVSLGWDPDPEPNVAGYKLYYGAASGSYTNNIDVGNVTTATIEALAGGVTYYFAARAYDTLGLESAYSDELSYAVPSTVTNTLPIIQSGDFEYANDGTSITITKYTGSGGVVIIPATIHGEPVTSLGNAAFQFSLNLTSVSIPTNVISIGDWAFYGCTSLAGVTIPNSVTSIGNRAFQRCVSLSHVNIPASVTSIGNLAFDLCDALLAITVDSLNSMYSSPGGVLYNKGLTTLIEWPGGKGNDLIPGNVTSIEDYAFDACANLTTLALPSSVTSIGMLAFASCSGLTSIGLPNGVTSIGDYAFYGCTRLVSVAIPNSVGFVESGVFASCSSLTNISLPNSVTSIGTYAFYGCTSLTSVTIPESVAFIGSGAFSGCTGLISVTISDGVTSVGAYAFDACTSLTALILPSSVTSVGLQAFAFCSSLTSITIPTSVTSIGDNAFYGCASLTTAYFQGNAPATFGTNVFDGTADGFTVYCLAGSTGFSSATWNGYSTSPYVQNGDFECTDNGTNITIIGYIGTGGAVTIPAIINGEPVTSVGDSAFQYCGQLGSVAIPDSLTSIGSYAFQGCTSLSSVTIPNSVTAMGTSTFRNCTALTRAYFQGNAPVLDAHAFDNEDPGFVVYYLASSTGFTSPIWNGYPSLALY